MSFCPEIGGGIFCFVVHYAVLLRVSRQPLIF